jgi:hypothetical protein
MAACGQSATGDRASTSTMMLHASYAEIHTYETLTRQADAIIVAVAENPGEVEMDRYDGDQGIPYTVTTISVMSVLQSSRDSFTERSVRLLQTGSTESSFGATILEPDVQYLLFLERSQDPKHSDEWVIVGHDQGLYRYSEPDGYFVPIGTDRPGENPRGLRITDGDLTLVSRDDVRDRVCRDLISVLSAQYPENGGTLVADLSAVDMSGTDPEVRTGLADLVQRLADAIDLSTSGGNSAGWSTQEISGAVGARCDQTVPYQVVIG